MIVALNKVIAQRTGQLRVAAVNDDVQKVFKLTRLHQLVKITKTTDDAIESFDEHDIGPQLPHATGAQAAAAAGLASPDPHRHRHGRPWRTRLDRPQRLADAGTSCPVSGARQLRAARHDHRTTVRKPPPCSSD